MEAIETFTFEDLAGCCTPVSPIPLDFPSMTPTATTLETSTKRQRKFSNLGAGYCTPSTSMTPIPLDFPSMTPRATPLESSVKRQRTFSNFSTLDDFAQQPTSCTFEMEGDTDFQQVWDSLDTEHPLLISETAEPPYSFEQPKLDEKKAKRKVSKASQRSERSPPTRTLSAYSTRSGSSVERKAPRRTRSSPNLVQQPARLAQVFPGRCAPDKRKEKVAKYLEKRSHRVWKKEIKYSCRKQFAESRPRIAGRFIPKPKKISSESTSTLSPVPKNETDIKMDKLFFQNDVDMVESRPISPMSSSASSSDEDAKA